MPSVSKSYSFDDESEDNGSESGSTGTCTFPFRFEDYVGRVENSVGRVRGMVSGVLFTIGIKSIGDIVLLIMLVPIGVESKGGQLVEIF